MAIWHDLGFDYKEQAERWFIDKHTTDKSIRYRDEFIKYEYGSYQWKYLQESIAKN